MNHITEHINNQKKKIQISRADYKNNHDFNILYLIYLTKMKHFFAEDDKMINIFIKYVLCAKTIIFSEGKSECFKNINQVCQLKISLS